MGAELVEVAERCALHLKPGSGQTFAHGREDGFGLLRREKIVPVQISNASYDNNYEERYEARTEVYGEGKY